MNFSKILSYLALVVLVIGAGFLLKDVIEQGVRFNKQGSIGSAILTLGFVLLLVSRFISAIRGRRR